MKALIFGSGAQGRVTLEILQAQGGYESIEFVDDNATLWGHILNGARIRGAMESVPVAERAVYGLVVAIGQPPLRVALAERAKSNAIALLNAIHPSAVISPTATIGEGNMIGIGAVVHTGARIGSNVIVNTHALVEHDAVVEDGVSFGSGVQVAARTRIGREAFLGVNALVLPRVSVGEGAVVGAGAVVAQDVPARVVVGSPARPLYKVDESFDWKRFL